jgi:hypothetical protein
MKRIFNLRNKMHAKVHGAVSSNNSNASNSRNASNRGGKTQATAGIHNGRGQLQKSLSTTWISATAWKPAKRVNLSNNLTTSNIRAQVTAGKPAIKGTPDTPGILEEARRPATA